jgi:hypothetical protein
MAYTTIDDPSAYFQTLLYTGDGNDNRNLVNTGNSDLQPDWIWNKRRDNTSNHFIFDSSRGVSKIIVTDTNEAESTNTNQLQAFQTDGFQLGSDNGSNGSSRTMVAWQWKANGGTTASNSDGSITSTVQANTTAGFSIVTYNGEGDSQATVGHGLGVKPQVIIPKNRGTTGNWHMYHEGVDSSAPENYGLLLNAVNVRADDPGFYNDTAPTSSVFTVGTYNNFNNDYVAYCFAEKQGYSKFGSYTGNGSEDGPFVYTGFKPQWILFKNTGAAEEWVLYDTKRDSTNPNTKTIRVDSNIAEAEATTLDIDFLSNGFKNRSNQAQLNSSGVLYIYMAFAEHPFVSSEGVPTTAR